MNDRDIQSLGELLQFALTNKARPAKIERYRELLNRLQQDMAFHRGFEALAEGMGLRVLSSDDFGVVLGSAADGPFAIKPADFRPNLKKRDQAVYSLVLLATASWCYPRANDLDQVNDTVRSVKLGELVDYVREIAERLEKQSTEDAVADYPELREAWRDVLAKAVGKRTSSGRQTTTVLSGLIKKTLDRLVDFGLLIPAGDKAWKTTRRFHVQMRELAAHEAFRLVDDAAARGRGGH